MSSKLQTPPFRTDCLQGRQILVTPRDKPPPIPRGIPRSRGKPPLGSRRRMDKSVRTPLQLYKSQPNLVRLDLTPSRKESRKKIVDDLWNLTADMRKPKLKPLDIPGTDEASPRKEATASDTESLFGFPSSRQKKTPAAAGRPPRPAVNKRTTRQEMRVGGRQKRMAGLTLTRPSREVTRNDTFTSQASLADGAQTARETRGKIREAASRQNLSKSSSIQDLPEARNRTRGSSMNREGTPASERPIDVPATTKEFTFTGYDIMADVRTPTPLTADARHAREVKKLYTSACRLAGVTPKSQVETMLLTGKLSIPSASLGPKGVQAICVALVENEHVIDLDLSDNWLEETGARYVSQVLQQNTTIQKLNLADNKIRTVGLEAVSNALLQTDRITELNIAGSEIEDLDAEYLALLLQETVSIKILDLSHNKLREKGALVLGKALAKNQTLEVLLLSWNHLRGKGAVCIARGLQKNKSLLELDLAWNGFGQEGAAAVGQAISENDTLTSLDVANNRLNADAVACIMKGLKTNSSLRTLKLGGNPLIPRVATTIIRVVQVCHRCALVELDLSEVIVFDEFEEILKQIQETRPNFRCKYEFAVEKTAQAKRETEDSAGKPDPTTVMFDHMRKEGFRVVDILKKFDSENTNQLTLEEFVNSIMLLTVPLSRAEVARVGEAIDEEATGYVDLDDVANAEKRYRRRLMKKKMAEEKAALQKAREMKNDKAALEEKEFWPTFNL